MLPLKPGKSSETRNFKGTIPELPSVPSEKVDVVVVPSTTCHPKIEEMQADPVKVNAKLGYFSHSGNVLDLCGIGINAGWDGSLPFGITFLGGSGTDGKVFDIVKVFEETMLMASDKH